MASIVALCGHHIGRMPDDRGAQELMALALEHGVNVFQCAWEFQQGVAETRLGNALCRQRDDVVVLAEVCTHGRGGAVAMQQLEETLRRLQTDHVDILMLHEVGYESEPSAYRAVDGAIDALVKARHEGKTRLIGFSGHKHPSIHLEMLEHGAPFDACALPINPFDATFRSFETSVLPLLLERKIIPIGIKPLCGGDPVRAGLLTVEEGLRYAFGSGVSTTICGIDSMAALQETLSIAANFSPMTADETSALRARCAEYSADGRMELYKTSLRYDLDEGRQVHGFASRAELPL